MLQDIITFERKISLIIDFSSVYAIVGIDFFGYTIQQFHKYFITSNSKKINYRFLVANNMNAYLQNVDFL